MEAKIQNLMANNLSQFNRTHLNDISWPIVSYIIKLSNRLFHRITHLKPHLTATKEISNKYEQETATSLVNKSTTTTIIMYHIKRTLHNFWDPPSNISSGSSILVQIQILN